MKSKKRLANDGYSQMKWHKERSTPRNSSNLGHVLELLLELVGVVDGLTFPCRNLVEEGREGGKKKKK
jgi:hypothetical protein